jgi:mannose-6-phosphate isomerase-like protein (cupin superfamily)
MSLSDQFTIFKQFKFRILKTGKETNGEYDLLEYEYFPKEKNSPPHYHTEFTEKYTIIKGMLIMEVANDFKLLTVGDSYLVEKNKPHSFFNHTSENVRFTVEIRPASEPYIKGVIIRQGLLKDGLCKKNGIPKKISHLLVLMSLGKTYIPGLKGLIQKLMLQRANSFKIKTIEKELLKKYYEPYE